MKLHRDERGFTLVELLIVVTILGFLAGVVTTTVLNASSQATLSACQTEFQTVQIAMDVMIAAQGVSSVTPSAGKTKFWDVNPTGAGTEPLYPKYLRQDKTQYQYTWTADGSVTVATGPCK